MYYEVYIDIVFVTNLLMDYILLRFVGMMFRCRGSRKRCLLAAAIGALFSCLILYIPMDSSSTVPILLHGACAMCMVRIGCGLKKGGLLVKAMLMLYLTAFLCGGFWEVVTADSSITLKTFLLFALCTYLGIGAMVYLADSVRTRIRNIYPITLAHQGKVQSAYGFHDTGNLLADPISGRPVSIVKPEFLETMLSEEVVNKLRYLQENPGEMESTEVASLRPHYLSYQTVGQKEGVLLAVTLEDLCIHTPREAVHISNPVFALSFESDPLGKEEYKVLLNSRLLH